MPAMNKSILIKPRDCKYKEVETHGQASRVLPGQTVGRSPSRIELPN